MYLPIVLILLCSLVNSDPVNIELNIAQFHCPIPNKHWCGELFLYEVDNLTGHDLHRQQQFCLSEGARTLKYSLEPEGDFRRL